MNKLKKSCILVLMAATLFAELQAQNLFSEDFNSGEIPSGWIVENGMDNWAVMPSMAAGGSPGELRLSGEPYFNNTCRIISPEISSIESTNIYLRFRHAFFPLDIDTTYRSLRLAIRQADSEWNTVWQLTDPFDPVPPSNEYVYLNGLDPAEETFQFCFTFTGESSVLYDWFIDNILVFNQVELDAEMYSLNISNYGIQGEHNVQGRINNLGYTSIDALEVKYSVDESQETTKLITNIDIGFGESVNFTFDESPEFSPGKHVIKVWISEVSYLGPDNNPLNDTLYHTIRIADQSFQRKLLFEEFASSSCYPCAAFNENILHPLLESNPGTHALLKYPMNYPSPGDPYYTENAQIRKDYYGTTNLPKLYSDGGFGIMSQSQYNIMLDKPSFTEIAAEAILSGTYLDVSASLQLGVDIDKAKLFIAVTEKTTTGNVQNNGETVFYHVLMQMIPSAEGILVEGQAGDTLEFNEGMNLSDTFIEDFNDIEVVVFLQDDQSKQILQSSIADFTVGIEEEKSTMNQIKVFPNPFKESGTLEIKLDKEVYLEIFISNMQGQLIRKLSQKELGSGMHSFIWDGKSYSGSSVEPGMYFLHIKAANFTVVRKIIKSGK